ncbi:MAG TPA: dTDP-4-dehydrorhamnose 3,5-epimerase [Methanothrix sp.]|jgi:dTDP-4-dehydrorhamnose 3,5-epimerase|nr:dTDP-4-dehydrorhamnose 3,5-epimerase [Methanothrix sp.]
MPFEFEELGLPGVLLIRPKIFRDDRGYFLETYKKEDLARSGIEGEFVQDNCSRSAYGVLRGMHFQREPRAQAKIVQCTRGVIYDVAVDLRRDSTTFKRYASAILSENNRYQLYVPRGFAHGFLVLSDIAEVMYKVDNPYSPESEGGLIWDDPEVNIKWPIDHPVLTERDKSWPGLKTLIIEGSLF